MKRASNAMASLIRTIKRYEKIICVAIIIMIGLTVAGKGIDRSGLWYDEAIEYWFSKVLTGPAPGQRLVDSMYLRIKGTFQPPLYNVLMYFWLMLFDSEVGFRYGGVVLIVLAAIGIYYGIREFSDSSICGLLSGLFYLSLFSTVFYAQECAEYALVMCAISWTTYFWISLMKSFSEKRLILFMLFCCISLYSQYGAAFPVAGMGVVLIGSLAINRKWGEFKSTLLCAIASFIMLILPLMIFFLIPQAKGATNSLDHVMVIDGGILRDFAASLYQVLSFLYGVWIEPSAIFIEIVQICIIISLVVFVIIAGLMTIVPIRNFSLHKIDFGIHGKMYLDTTSMLFISWLMFYLAVKLKYYGISYQSGFGTRYSIVMGPGIVLLVVMGLSYIYQFFNKADFRRIVCVCILCFGVISIWNNLNVTYQRAANNWVKGGVREAAVMWLAEKDYEYPTIVNVTVDPVFEFYMAHAANRSKDVRKNVIPIEGTADATLNTELIDKMLGEQWPKKFIYLGAPNIEVDSLYKEFSEKGFIPNTKYEASGILMIEFEKVD